MKTTAAIQDWIQNKITAAELIAIGKAEGREVFNAEDMEALKEMEPFEKVEEDSWANCHAHDAKEFRDGR